MLLEHKIVNGFPQIPFFMVVAWKTNRWVMIERFETFQAAENALKKLNAV